VSLHHAKHCEVLKCTPLVGLALALGPVCQSHLPEQHEDIPTSCVLLFPLPRQLHAILMCESQLSRVSISVRGNVAFLGPGSA